MICRKWIRQELSPKLRNEAWDVDGEVSQRASHTIAYNAFGKSSWVVPAGNYLVRGSTTQLR